MRCKCGLKRNDEPRSLGVVARQGASGSLPLAWRLCPSQPTPKTKKRHCALLRAHETSLACRDAALPGELPSHLCPISAVRLALGGAAKVASRL